MHREYVVGIGLAALMYAGTFTWAFVREPAVCTPQSGPRWIGESRYDYGFSQEWAEQFADYPLFWLGEQFAGYDLQFIDYRPWPFRADFVEFFYGVPYGWIDFDILCTAPVTVRIVPACLRRNLWPEGEVPHMRGAAVTYVRERVGSLDGVLPGTRVRIWTGPVVIEVRGKAPIAIDRIVQEMQGIGPSAHIRPGDPLPPPDVSRC